MGDQVKLWASLLLFAMFGLTWSVVAIPAYLLLPRQLGSRIGRLGFNRLTWLYVSWLALIGAYRLDLSAMDALRRGPAVILAPNHPSMIDAVLILSAHPRIVCVMKSVLKKNVILGSGARLARYISNHPPRRMVLDAVVELQRGQSLLLFPEGTRTISAPVNSFTTSAGLIAKRAKVAVQTLIVETDSPFLSKGWSPFHRPVLPITYRIRLGRRFDPPENVRAFDELLEAYFRTELAGALQNIWLNEHHSHTPR